jgi:hypothetical protein
MARAALQAVVTREVVVKAAAARAVAGMAKEVAERAEEAQEEEGKEMARVALAEAVKVDPGREVEDTRAEAV